MTLDCIRCHLRKHEEFLQQSHSILCDNLGKSPGEEGAQEGVGACSYDRVPNGSFSWERDKGVGGGLLHVAAASYTIG